MVVWFIDDTHTHTHMNDQDIIRTKMALTSSLCFHLKDIPPGTKSSPGIPSSGR